MTRQAKSLWLLAAVALAVIGYATVGHYRELACRAASRSLVQDLGSSDEAVRAASLALHLADGCLAPSPYLPLVGAQPLWASSAPMVVTGVDGRSFRVIVGDSTSGALLVFQLRSGSCPAPNMVLLSVMKRTPQAQEEVFRHPIE
jgi:hypothetical protein